MDLLTTLVLPAAFAGLVAVLVTLAIERFGGVVGGFLGTLPSTVVPASFGMYATLSPHGFEEALCTVPPGMFLNALFLWLWRAVPPRLPDAPLSSRLAVMIGLSLTAWASGALLLVGATDVLLFNGLPPVVLGGVSTAALVVLGVAACWNGVPAPKGKNRVSPAVLFARGSLAAGAIAVAILLAYYGSPLLAGVASVFPAIFITTMVSVWWSQGDAVTTGAVGPMMLGSTAVAAYALGAALLFPALGPVVGCVVSWLVAAVGFTLPATTWLRARR